MAAFVGRLKSYLQDDIIMTQNKAVKLYNSLKALAVVSGNNLDNLSVNHEEGGRWGKKITRTIEGLTKQQSKLALALADSSYSAIYECLDYRSEYQRAKDLQAFVVQVCVTIDDTNPVHTALGYLGIRG